MSANLNFPNQIEVTLGSAWTGKNGLSPNDVLPLTKVAGENWWTEDGTGTANDSTNRIRFRPVNFELFGSTNSAGVNIDAADDGWQMVGQTTRTGTAFHPSYTLGQVWGGEGSGMMYSWMSGYMYGFLDDSFASYNNDIFSSIEEAGDPAISTLDPDQITETTARLNGNLTSLGSESNVDVFFRWRETGEETWNETTKVDRSATGTFNATIESLTKGTQYEFKTVVEWDSGGESEIGETVQFFTQLFLRGTAKIGETPVEGAKIFIKEIGEPDTESDSSGEWEVEINPALEYHAFAQYENNGTKYNAPSFPFLNESEIEPPQPFDFNVQRGEAHLTTGNNSIEITLDTPVPVGESFATISSRGDSGSNYRILGYITLIDIVNDHYTKIRIEKDTGTSSESWHSWEVVTCDEFTVEQVTTKIDSNETVKTETINEIDLSKTFILFSGIGDNDANDGRNIAIRASFDNNTSTRFQRNTSRSSPHFINAFIITIPDSKVQSGTVSVSNRGNVDNIEEVNMEKSFLVASWISTAQSSNPNRFFIQGNIITPTQVEFSRTVTNDNIDIHYFVIENPRLKVSKVTAYLPSTETNRYVKLNNVNKSFFATFGNFTNAQTTETSTSDSYVTASLSENNVEFKRYRDEGLVITSAYIIH